jgi:hypothetical protein
MRKLTSFKAFVPLSYTLCTPLNSIKETPPCADVRRRNPGGNRKSRRLAGL